VFGLIRHSLLAWVCDPPCENKLKTKTEGDHPGRFRSRTPLAGALGFVEMVADAVDVVVVVASARAHVER
jgi:hypothetical protein